MKYYWMSDIGLLTLNQDYFALKHFMSKISAGIVETELNIFELFVPKY